MAGPFADFAGKCGGSKKETLSVKFRFYSFSRLNQERAKKAVMGMHKCYPSCMCGRHCNGVTSFEVKHPARGNRKLVFSQRPCWMYHGNDFVVHKERNPHRSSPVAAPVNLFIDVVSSSHGHDHFSILVLHTASKVAVWLFKVPVFDH